MDVPNWVKWVGLAGLVVWIVTDPKGLGSVINDLFNGIVTVFKTVA